MFLLVEFYVIHLDVAHKMRHKKEICNNTLKAIRTKNGDARFSISISTFFVLSSTELYHVLRRYDSDDR